MSGVMLAWLVEAGIIAYRDVRTKRVAGGLPIPGDFLATFVIFGGLAAIGSSPQARGFANLTAWGLVVATALDVVDPTFVKPISTSITNTAGAVDKTPAKGVAA